MSSIRWGRGWRTRFTGTAGAPPLRSLLPWAAVIGLLMSTQFLFQPFVWRNFPVGDVLLAWLDFARDGVVAAVSIALALWLAAWLPARGTAGRALLLGAAVLSGAMFGQFALSALGGPGAAQGTPSMVARALRWSLVAASVAGIYFLWRRAVDARVAVAASELRRVQTERQVAQARLQALRSQIEPHFLFNTLATVRQLRQTEPAGGNRLLAQFLDYLRLTLPSTTSRPQTLGTELDLVEAYLGLIAVRMSGRLQVEFDVAAGTRGAAFPPLVLATLVENAIKHGLGPAAAGGSIHIAVRRDARSLVVDVADTGVGFAAAGSGGTGIGLANIRARLQTLHGGAAELSLHAEQPHGVRARVKLPLQLASEGA